MQTVKELADELGVSKQAVHKKIEKLGIRDQLQVVDRKLMVDDNQANAISKAFFDEKKTYVRQPNVNHLNNDCKAVSNENETCVRQLKRNVDDNQASTISKAFFDEKKTYVRQPNVNQVDDDCRNVEINSVCTVNQKEKMYSEDYVDQLLQRIDGLEKDKADLKSEKADLLQRNKEQERHIMEMSERLTVLLDQQQQLGAMDKLPESTESKKGIFARLFGK